MTLSLVWGHGENTSAFTGKTRTVSAFCPTPPGDNYADWSIVLRENSKKANMKKLIYRENKRRGKSSAAIQFKEKPGNPWEIIDSPKTLLLRQVLLRLRQSVMTKITAISFVQKHTATLQLRHGSSVGCVRDDDMKHALLVEKTALFVTSVTKPPFLQGVSIACYAEPCISYDRAVRLSVCLSHTACTEWKRRKLGSQFFYRRIAQGL